MSSYYDDDVGGSSSSSTSSSSSASGSASSSSGGFEAYSADTDAGIPAYHDSDYGKEGSTMAPGDTCQVQCKCLYINERFIVSANGSTRVKDLRRALAGQAGHPEDRMELYHHGYALRNDDLTLSEAQFGKGEPRVYYIYLEPDRMDSAFTRDLPDLKRMKRHFDTSGLLNRDDAEDIVRMAKKIIRDEPNMVEVDDPVSIIGDIHGQWYDMAGIMRAAGKFGQRNHLFLGDYVDRGYFSCEVILYLLAAKINYPNHVFLLRGNHETDVICRRYGFQEEAKFKYGRRFTKSIVDLFQYLPFLAQVNSGGKKILGCHGGISPLCLSLADVERINRVKEPSRNTPLKDFIWADPTKDFALKDDVRDFDLSALPEHPKSSEGGNYEDGFEPGGRGGGTDYGYNSTLQFLAQNDVLSVFRGHEQQPDGLQQFRAGPKYKFPSVCTVFSAPNYTDTSKNRGSVAWITGGKLKFKDYTWAVHPQFFKYKRSHHHEEEDNSKAFDRNMDSEDLIQFINCYQHDLLRMVPFPALKGEYIHIFKAVLGHPDAETHKDDIEASLSEHVDYADVRCMPDEPFTAEQLAEINRRAQKIFKKYKGKNFFQLALAKEAVYEQDPDGSTFAKALATIKQREDIVGQVARNLNVAGAKALYGKAERFVCGAIGRPTY